jgi:hypothetical protein
MAERQFLTTPAAAARIGLAASTMEKLRVYGGGPPYYAISPRKVVYAPAELDEWVQSKRRRSTSEYKIAA